ncbi:Cys-tRNA(Pro) deacylase [Fusobacterium sp. SYSU M8D902]|uniref:Cys-tRNA(Pro) deacylase n=1 Tax=Fusobacterium sp. SYSU M8D902 TaxID=3159562 RepID=UPI0032E4B75C
MKKTNAMRELDKSKITYNYREYEVDENDLSAIAVSLKTGQDITKIFKTLVLLTEKKEMIVACIAGADNIDLKKLAKLAEVKKVEMLELKELFNMTGYIRGGCSPIGIKKRHRSFIDSSVLTKDIIMISAGIRGLQILINPQDLIKHLNMTVGDIIVQ